MTTGQLWYLASVLDVAKTNLTSADAVCKDKRNALHSRS
eukprot:CAMPEP_0197657918 /NCGR_PEP_ID=MMETSP1338-20131121/44923_1 /TAXON_ID=43686 ORGANISM="Pelagodinium beii, Strain RCC1491" /NCGR_SAMPLE_ID=MMETSP1338 /ASSEMBLY_ACC=CAM_ASM_000754 /LENGTH=38 /DNA_ID= /DNA_START= /DNA_END= /DNA_ORIENTATION=